MIRPHVKSVYNMHGKLCGQCKSVVHLSLVTQNSRQIIFSGKVGPFPPRTTASLEYRTVLLYPLTPFFVIFCNFVATSNFHDLMLLKDATATISSIPEHFPFSKNLQKLLSQLIALCSHLETPWKHTQIDEREKDPGPSCKTPQLPLPSPITTSNGAVISELSHMRTTSDTSVTPGTNMSPQVTLASFGQEGAHAEPKRNSIWDDERLWELFSVQPSVEWFDSDYFTNFISS